MVVLELLLAIVMSIPAFIVGICMIYAIGGTFLALAGQPVTLLEFFMVKRKSRPQTREWQ